MRYSDAVVVTLDAIHVYMLHLQIIYNKEQCGFLEIRHKIFGVPSCLLQFYVPTYFWSVIRLYHKVRIYLRSSLF